MWWNTLLLSLSLLPGSYTLDPLSLPHTSDDTFSIRHLQKRDDGECIPGTMSGSKYCPTCDGIDAPTPNMFIKCQDSVDKTSDDQNNAYQEEHGECRVYHPQWPDVSKDQEQPKCTRYCQRQASAEEDATAACVGFTPKTGDPQIDDNFFYSFRDAEGRYYEMGKCECSMELAEVVLDIVLEGMAEAMQEIASVLFVACRLFAEALQLVCPFLLAEAPAASPHFPRFQTI